VRRTLALAAACALLLAACGDGDGTGEPQVTGTLPPLESPAATAAATPPAATSPEPTRTPAATPTATASPVPQPTAAPAPAPFTPGPVGLSPYAPDLVLQTPVELIAYPGSDQAMLIVDQSGTVAVLTGGDLSTVLDIRAQVTHEGERGLLSFAFDPAFESTGHVWLYYWPAGTPPRTVLARYTVQEDGIIDPDSALVVLEVQQPFTNHNGGSVRFGPDGMLYLGIGDGGAAGDPQGHGQNLGTLLGSIIRIDVSQASSSEPYRIPPDNPFLDTPGAQPEIWAYGLRNPWRMAFDPLNGALWVADVGQSEVEEVSIATAGANLGWNIWEGNQCYPLYADCSRDGYTMPLAVYFNAGGRCSISGGIVVRGSTVPELEGAYIFGDYCSGEVWAMSADEPDQVVQVAEGLGSITSFAQVAGEVFVVAFDRPLQRLVSP
jgi:glucose/arabinose dehydrogenase